MLTAGVTGRGRRRHPCGSAVPEEGSGTRPLRFEPGTPQPSPLEAIPRRAPPCPRPAGRAGLRPAPAPQAAWRRRPSRGWAGPVPQCPPLFPDRRAGASPPSPSTLRRTGAPGTLWDFCVWGGAGRPASSAAPGGKSRSQGSPTACGEGTAWRGGAPGPLRAAPSRTPRWVSRVPSAATARE